MQPFLLLTTAFIGQCQYNLKFLNYDGWINATVLLVIGVLMVTSAVYAISGLLPSNTREKLRGAVKYEYIQGIFSIILIAVLFTASLAACEVGGALTQGASYTYSDPFQFANYYISNLLFNKGIQLTTQMWSAGVLFIIDAFIVNYVLSLAASFIPPITITSGRVLGLKILPAIAVGGNDQAATIIYDYNSILYLILEPLVVVTFGLLFVIFLALYAIESLSLTLVIPVAIIMRSLSFTGPRLREASNALIAISIAFYFVFPLTIAMNYYVVSWTYCLGSLSGCNPYATQLLPYQLNSLPLNQLLNNPTVDCNLDGIGVCPSQTTPLIGIPLNFWAAIASSNGGLASAGKEVLTGLYNLPGVINNFTEYTAQFLFQSIFLIGLDVGITIGFAVGLNKGISTIGSMIGSGPFWS
jgi:hypothetical protein